MVVSDDFWMDSWRRGYLWGAVTYNTGHPPSAAVNLFYPEEKDVSLLFRLCHMASVRFFPSAKCNGLFPKKKIPPIRNNPEPIPPFRKGGGGDFSPSGTSLKSP